jgi:hypothetical protein
MLPARALKVLDYGVLEGEWSHVERKFKGARVINA